MHQPFEKPASPNGGYPGQTAGSHLVFTQFRFPGNRRIHLFFTALLYNAGAEQGFGGDFTRGSRPLLEEP